MSNFFEDLAEEIAAAQWSVSTLTPGLHGRPIYKHFSTPAKALEYARSRVKAGPRLKEGGKAYFILNAAGDQVYRVVRVRRQVKTPGGTFKSRPVQDVLFVQKRNPKARTDNEKWIHDESLTVILPGAEQEDIRHGSVSRNEKHVSIPAQTPEQVEDEKRAQIERFRQERSRIRRGLPRKD